MFLLLFTANGIFEPLEVALNRAWGVTKNRSYIKNQLVSLGLIFVCGGLALLSLMLTALNSQWLSAAGSLNAGFGVWINLLMFKLAAVPISILALFLVYWLLPNRKVEPARVVPVAIVVGLALEALKYVNLLVAPLLQAKLHREYLIFRALRHHPAVELRGCHDRAGRGALDRAPGPGRSAIVGECMKDWKAIAKASGLEVDATRARSHRRDARSAGSSLPSVGERSHARCGTGHRVAPRGGRRVTIREAADALRARRVSAVELAAAANARIEPPQFQAECVHHRHRRTGSRRGAAGGCRAGRGPRPRAPPRNPRRRKRPFRHARRAHHLRLQGL